LYGLWIIYEGTEQMTKPGFIDYTLCGAVIGLEAYLIRTILSPILVKHGLEDISMYVLAGWFSVFV